MQQDYIAAPPAAAVPQAETVCLTADVVVTATDVNGNLNVLLVRRAWPPYQGFWALPGGHVNAGEEARVAASRELEEETGLEVPPSALREIGVWHGVRRDPRGRYVTVLHHVEVGKRLEVQGRDDATKAEWWPVYELPRLLLAFDHRDLLRAAEVDPRQLRTDSARRLMAESARLATNTDGLVVAVDEVPEIMRAAAVTVDNLALLVGKATGALRWAAMEEGLTDERGGDAARTVARIEDYVIDAAAKARMATTALRDAAAEVDHVSVGADVDTDTGDENSDDERVNHTPYICAVVEALDEAGIAVVDWRAPQSEPLEAGVALAPDVAHNPADDPITLRWTEVSGWYWQPEDESGAPRGTFESPAAMGVVPAPAQVAAWARRVLDGTAERRTLATPRRDESADDGVVEALRAYAMTTNN